MGTVGKDHDTSTFSFVFSSLLFSFRFVSLQVLLGGLLALPGLVAQRVRRALRVHGAALVNGRILRRDNNNDTAGKAALTDHIERVFHTQMPSSSFGLGLGVGVDEGVGMGEGDGVDTDTGTTAGTVSLASQEAALLRMVLEAVTMIRADTPLYGHPGEHRDALVAVNQRLLLLVDAIATMVEATETFCQRFEAMSELVAAVMCNKYHRVAEKGVAMVLTRLIISCCCRSNINKQEQEEEAGECDGDVGGEFQPSDEAEVQLCYYLAEAISNPTPPLARGLSLTGAAASRERERDRDDMSELGLSSERVVTMVVRGWGKGSVDGISGGGGR